MDRPARRTDIIAGLPSETEADFEQTIALPREMGFAKMHVFPFSPRVGTAAAKIQDKVSSVVIKERAKILRDLDRRIQHRYHNRFLGKTAQVLIENINGRPSGRTERCFMVYLDNLTRKPDNNTIVAAEIKTHFKYALLTARLSSPTNRRSESPRDSISPRQIPHSGCVRSSYQRRIKILRRYIQSRTSQRISRAEARWRVWV